MTWFFDLIYTWTKMGHFENAIYAFANTFRRMCLNYHLKLFLCKWGLHLINFIHPLAPVNTDYHLLMVPSSYCTSSWESLPPLPAVTIKCEIFTGANIPRSPVIPSEHTFVASFSSFHESKLPLNTLHRCNCKNCENLFITQNFPTLPHVLFLSMPYPFT